MSVSTSGTLTGKLVTVNTAASLVPGSNYHTIQQAIDFYKGKSICSCVISVSPGVYDEVLTTEGLTNDNPYDLHILGDTRASSGITFVMHGTFGVGNRTNVVNMGGQNGVITLSNPAAGQIQVANSVADPVFTGIVVTGDRCYVRNDLGNFEFLNVTGNAVGNIIPVAALVGNTAAAGSSVTLMPNRVINCSTAGTAVTVTSHCCFTGFAFMTPAVAASNIALSVLDGGSVLLENCFFGRARIGIFCRNNSYVGMYNREGLPSFLGGATGTSLISSQDCDVSLLAYDRSFVKLNYFVSVGSVNFGVYAVEHSSCTVDYCVVAWASNCLFSISGSTIKASNSILVGLIGGARSYSGSYIDSSSSVIDMLSGGVGESCLVAIDGSRVLSDTSTLTQADVGVYALRNSSIVARFSTLTTIVAGANIDTSSSIIYRDVVAGYFGTCGSGTFCDVEEVGDGFMLHIEFTTTGAVTAAGTQSVTAPIFTFNFPTLITGTELNLMVTSSGAGGDTPDVGIGTTAGIGNGVVAGTECDIMNAYTMLQPIAPAPGTGLVNQDIQTTPGTWLPAAQVIHFDMEENPWTNDENITVTGYIRIFCKMVFYNAL